jgi:hypothetical protein
MSLRTQNEQDEVNDCVFSKRLVRFATVFPLSSMTDTARAMLRFSDALHFNTRKVYIRKSHLNESVWFILTKCSTKKLNTQEMKMRMKFTDLLVGLALLMVPGAANGKLCFPALLCACVKSSLFAYFPCLNQLLMVTLFANASGTIEFRILTHAPLLLHEGITGLKNDKVRTLVTCNQSESSQHYDTKCPC